MIISENEIIESIGSISNEILSYSCNDTQQENQ